MPPTESTVLCGCGRFMRVVKNSVTVEELTETGRAYKLWDGDRYQCPECGATVITGFAFAPLVWSFQVPAYAELRESRAPVYPGRCRPVES